MKKLVFCLTAATAVCLSLLPLSACKKKSEPEKISSYDINLTYDEEDGTLCGSTRFNFYNSTENQITALEFNLWGNAYREGAQYRPVSDAFEKAYYDGESFGKMEVDKVENCASWEIGGEDENLLCLTLSEPVYPDQTAEVTITYCLTLAKVNHRTGITENTVNLGNFFPILCAYDESGFVEAPYYSCGDPFVSDCANFCVSLTLPAEYIAATSGREVERSVAGNSQTLRFEQDRARDFAAVISNKYKRLEKAAGGCTVTAYYCGESAPERQLEAVCRSVEYFGEILGEYPYSTLSVAFTPLSVSGMEYPALVMIDDSLDEADGIYTAVHETAHQWWYATVGNDQVNCAFMDEGLAEYSTLCFFETHTEYGYTRAGILGGAVKAYRAYFSVYNQIFGEADTTMKRSLADFSSDYEYVNLVYNKSLLMFESVRCAMGDKKFFEALEEYYKNNRFKRATAEEMISHFVSRHDVEGIFNSFLEGKVVI